MLIHMENFFQILIFYFFLFLMERFEKDEEQQKNCCVCDVKKYVCLHAKDFSSFM